MTTAQFFVVPAEVLKALKGHPTWWIHVYTVVLEFHNYETGNFQTWVPVIRRKLVEEHRVKTRQGTAPCEKSIRRVLDFFRAAGFFEAAAAINRTSRCILGRVRGTLTSFFGKKNDSPSPVSKWKTRWAASEKRRQGAPVSKGGEQGIQTGGSFFKNDPVDNLARSAYERQGGAVTLETLRAYYR